eukprot:2278890-Rhodomonas_salina.1
MARPRSRYAPTTSLRDTRYLTNGIAYALPSTDETVLPMRCLRYALYWSPMPGTGIRLTRRY